MTKKVKNIKQFVLYLYDDNEFQASIERANRHFGEFLREMDWAMSEYYEAQKVAGANRDDDDTLYNEMNDAIGQMVDESVTKSHDIVSRIYCWCAIRHSDDVEEALKSILRGDD